MKTVRWKTSWDYEAYQVPEDIDPAANKRDAALLDSLAATIGESLGRRFTVTQYTPSSNIVGIRIIKHGEGGKPRTVRPGMWAVIRPGEDAFAFTDKEFRARFTDVDPADQLARREAVHRIAELLDVEISS